jgi:hypothetical protein
VTELYQFLGLASFAGIEAPAPWSSTGRKKLGMRRTTKNGSVSPYRLAWHGPTDAPSSFWVVEEICGTDIGLHGSVYRTDRRALETLTWDLRGDRAAPGCKATRRSLNAKKILINKRRKAMA